nr:hypothetical protein [Mycobacterium uberis]
MSGLSAGLRSRLPRVAVTRRARTGGHRLRRLVSGLNRAIELGAYGIALMTTSASVAHGYGIIDHYRIDPRPGYDANFD